MKALCMDALKTILFDYDLVSVYTTGMVNISLPIMIKRL
jgi:hypothetical protein